MLLESSLAALLAKYLLRGILTHSVLWEALRVNS